MMMLNEEGGPLQQMHAARVGVARAPYLFAGEDQHRRRIADEGVEESVEDGAISGALGGLRPGRRIDVAVEAVLADVEIEGRKVFIAEIGEEARVGVEVVIVDRRRELRSEEHTSELQYLMRISYAEVC